MPQPRAEDQGALAGKTLYVSAGHGFTWEAGASRWETQRGNTHQVVEDLISTETISQYLMPMLMNAGARVVTVRESDMGTAGVIVDNDGAGYAETGPGFSNSSLMGFGPLPAALTGTANPFALGTNRLMDAAATATASATYTAMLPADGEYNVYVSYTAFTARVTDAHYVVKHGGGESHFRVNQRRHGGTWVFLGRFGFRAGGTAQVQVLNDSASGTGNVSLDAVRFGAGTGLVDRGGGKSGRPRFEEAARYHAQFAGAPTTVYDFSSTDHNDDVSTRSRFAAWVHEPGEDAAYLAWHTNAFDGTAVGTDVYVYGPNPPDGTFNFTGVAGSDVLARKVHDELINDIRLGWNRPTWRDRGVHSAYFGELNPNHNDEMPAILMEIAFHDNAGDAAQLKEPAFRYLAARAITQGVIRYFAEKDSRPVVFPPEPPVKLSATRQSAGMVQVKWGAPPTDAQGVGGQAATKYRVYRSSDGLGWDDGVEVTGLSFTDTAPSLKYYRVTAVNDGGESFPSATLAARATQSQVLVINAYDRLDATQGRFDDLSAHGLGSVLRIFIARMNDGSYVRTHADALGPTGLGVDSATIDAVTSGDVTLSSYAAIDFLVGRGRPGGAALSAAEQQALASGRPVLFSGAPTADAAFQQNTLRIASAAPVTARNLAGEDFLAGVTGVTLDDGTRGSYLTGSPWAFSTTNATVVARYSSGEPAGVGVAQTAVTFGFPFETVTSRAQRVEIMGRAMKYLGVISAVPDAGPIDPPEPDGGTEPDAGMPPKPVTLERLPDQLGEEARKGCGCGSAGEAMAMLLAIAYLWRRR